MDMTLRCRGKPHYLSEYTVAGEEVVIFQQPGLGRDVGQSIVDRLDFPARLKLVRSESHMADPASTLLRFYAPHP